MFIIPLVFTCSGCLFATGTSKSSINDWFYKGSETWFCNLWESTFPQVVLRFPCLPWQPWGNLGIFWILKYFWCHHHLEEFWKVWRILISFSKIPLGDFKPYSWSRQVAIEKILANGREMGYVASRYKKNAGRFWWFSIFFLRHPTVPIRASSTNP